MMLKEDYIEASKEKGLFKFSFTKPSFDWYEDVNVSLPYDKYNCLILELRYGKMWWLLGTKYSEDNNKWICEQIGKIRETDIPRLVKWAEYTNKYGHKVSLLTNIRTIDGSLNPIREFLTIMSKYDKEGE